MAKDARRHLHRPLLGRSLRPAGRRPARGDGELRQIRRRMSHQHLGRDSAPRPEARTDHRRRRRAHGPLHQGAGRSRRGRHPGRQDRSRAADLARHPRDSRRAHLPLDLLPRQLRRFRADRERCRRGLHRIGRRGRGLGHPLLEAQPRRHEPTCDAARQEARRPGDLRHRLSPGALGADRPRPRRGALRRLRERLGPSADHSTGLRRDRRHRGRDPHRRRHHRHARAPAGRSASSRRKR